MHKFLSGMPGDQLTNQESQHFQGRKKSLCDLGSAFHTADTYTSFGNPRSEYGIRLHKAGRNPSFSGLSLYESISASPRTSAWDPLPSCHPFAISKTLSRNPGSTVRTSLVPQAFCSLLCLCLFWNDFCCVVTSGWLQALLPLGHSYAT